MAQQPQTIQNHTRFDPAFHFFLAPVALVILIGSIVELIRKPGWDTALYVLFAAWAFVALFLIRVYSLKVQDRVIRLEERLRLKELLPATLQGRIGELTEGQLVSLRFASDKEVSALVEKALDQKLSPKQIKTEIKVWRPDYWRV